MFRDITHDSHGFDRPHSWHGVSWLDGVSCVSCVEVDGDVFEVDGVSCVSCVEVDGDVFEVDGFMVSCVEVDGDVFEVDGFIVS